MGVNITGPIRHYGATGPDDLNRTFFPQVLPDFDKVGLFWSDGVEPADSTYYPVSDSNRVWYVDLDALSDGDGSEGSPVNNFTDLVGYYNGSSYVNGTLGFAGGDQIWVKGTGSASKHVNGVSNMNIDMRRDAQYGPTDNPTVIRSWLGEPAALFDGEYTENLGIYCAPTVGTNNGIVLINMEGTRSLGVPFNIDDNIQMSRVISCNAYLNYALNGGPASTYGGIVVRCSNGLRDHEVHNCRTRRNNTSNGTDTQASNNIGGINLLTQPSSDPLSTVSFYKNDVADENYAMRHKQVGQHIFNSSDNLIADSNIAHYVRNEGVNNVIENNVSGCTTGVHMESENQTQKRTVNVSGNTWTTVEKAIATDNASQTWHNDVDWDSNTYNNSAYAGPVLSFGQYPATAASIADLTGANNVVDMSGDDIIIVNGTLHDLAWYATETGDTTTTVI